MENVIIRATCKNCNHYGVLASLHEEELINIASAIMDAREDEYAFKVAYEYIDNSPEYCEKCHHHVNLSE